MKIDKPRFMEFYSDKKGRFFLLDLLIFFLIFLIAQLAAGIPAGIASVAAVFFLEPDVAAEMNEALMSGDSAAAMAMMPSWINLLSLFLTVITTLAVIIYIRFIEKEKLIGRGFTRKKIFSQYLIGLLLGAVMISLPVAVCLITKTASFDGISPDFALVMLLAFFIGFIFQGMSEEVLCRSYLMVNTERRHGIIFAIVLNSLVFMLLHGANSGLSVMAFVNLFLYGVFASLYMIRMGNIWGISAFHSAWNFFQGNFWGIKVSGTDMGTTVFSVSLKDGGELINGGAFGLEGGIAVTAVLVIGIVILLFMKNKDIGYSEQPAAAEEA